MNRIVKTIASTFLLSLLISPSWGSIWVFNAVLNGAQEVPPNSSPAVGSATMIYDDVTNLFNLFIAENGIPRSQIIGSHIHVGPPGVAGPVIFNIGDGSVYQDFGTTGAFFAGTNLGPFPQANEADLLANNTYINIHTPTFPGGEIRGQLILVPEPMSLAVLVGGLGLLALRRRRS
ncbi:MAG: CHRD domain-containing protein [Fimbriimonadales bacterium]|nr:CHRD domain-containing protein [Fimbriimonadales bacterium]